MRTAKISVDGFVEQCIVGTAEWAVSRLGGTWVDTEEKVGIGWTWSEENGFRPPQPFPSWSWADGVWVPPVPYPQSDDFFLWDEEAKEWVADPNAGV